MTASKVQFDVFCLISN